MGRKVHGYPPGVERCYIPQAYNNRQDPDPIKVWIRQPTEADKRRLTAGGEPYEFETRDGVTSCKVDLARAVEKQIAYVVGFVTRVEGYTSASDKPITDGAMLAELGEAAIVTEVADEIRDQLSLTETERKNSGQPSGSLPAATNPQAGIAESVSPTAGATTATVPGLALDFATSQDTVIVSAGVPRAG